MAKENAEDAAEAPAQEAPAQGAPAAEGEAPAEGAEGADEEGGGGKKKLIMIAGGVVVLLIAGGAGLYFTGMLDSLLGKTTAEEGAEAGKAGEHGAKDA